MTWLVNIANFSMQLQPTLHAIIALSDHADHVAVLAFAINSRVTQNTYVHMYTIRTCVHCKALVYPKSESNTHIHMYIYGRTRILFVFFPNFACRSLQSCYILASDIVMEALTHKLFSQYVFIYKQRAISAHGRGLIERLFS